MSSGSAGPDSRYPKGAASEAIMHHLTNKPEAGFHVLAGSRRSTLNFSAEPAY